MEINPRRLEWACQDRGISAAELAGAVHIAPAMLDQVMAGEGGLTFNQLRNVAKFFSRGVLFFVQKGDLDEGGLRTPQFRTLANQKPDLSPEVKSLIERAERQRDVYLDLRDDLQADDEGVFSPPVPDGTLPEAAARVVREWLDLTEQNDFATTRAKIESKGVLVLLAVGYSGEWRLPQESPIAGFSIYHERCPLILVKKQKNAGRQLFTLAHELAHLVLHRGSFIDEESDLANRRGREREANLFASHLLVTDAQLAKIDDNRRPQTADGLYEWLKPWINRWGVSAEMVLLRLLDDGRLKREMYDAYCLWRDALPKPPDAEAPRMYRHREPITLFGAGYVRTVLDSYHANRISLNKASGFLDNITVTDVHKLEAHVASL